jgi:DNA polymerase-1
MGVKRCEQEGFEADDLIGAVARRCTETGWECCIVTGDRDSFQLISDRVYVTHIKTRLGQTETVRYDLARFYEEYGFAPPRMVDLKALMGDSSDGIPGVPGVGEKTAMELMRRFGSLEGVYEHLDDPLIRESVRKKLVEGRESARLSFELAAIDTDVPLCFEPEDAVWVPAFGSDLYDIFQRLGFSRFIEKWGLQPCQDKSSLENQALPDIEVSDEETMETLCRALRGGGVYRRFAARRAERAGDCDGKAVYSVRWASAGGITTRSCALFLPGCEEGLPQC